MKGVLFAIKAVSKKKVARHNRVEQMKREKTVRSSLMLGVKRVGRRRVGPY